MAKVERGRLDGVWGMQTRTADELLAWARSFETWSTMENCPEDPRWLKRWAGRMRRLAAKKQRAIEHKQGQARRKRHGR